MRLAIVQMVLGGLVAIFSFLVTLGHPVTQFTSPPDESGMITTVFVNPVPGPYYYQLAAFLAMLLGLVVLGCGIAQLLKAGGLKGAAAL